MNPELRNYFDEQLEVVLGQLPDQVHTLLDKVPLVVEDYPSQQVLHKMGIRKREHLCGLYTGIPLTRRQVEAGGVLSDVIHLYREGVLNLSRDPQGAIDQHELQRQIRITVLHELGHHHGLSEEDLEELGY